MLVFTRTSLAKAKFILLGEVFNMKVKSSLIVPIIAASILAPTVGNTMAIRKNRFFQSVCIYSKRGSKRNSSKMGKSGKSKRTYEYY